MIAVKGFHGRLSGKLSKKMDGIALPITPGVEWEFEGSLEDFADKWQAPFLSFPSDKPRKDEFCSWLIFVTDHPSFQAR